MNTKTRALAAAAAAASALVAGCSSADTKNEYVDTVNEIQNSALDAFNTATTAAPENKAQLVEQLEAGESALADAVSQLEGVDVPSEAEDGHPELVAGIDDLRQLFADTAADVAEASPAQTLNAVTDLSTEGAAIGAQIDGAIDKINDALGAT